jgi:hypothetical protein
MRSNADEDINTIAAGSGYSASEIAEIDKKIESKRSKETFSRAGAILEIVKKELGIDIDYSVLLKVWENEIYPNKASICGYRKGNILAETDSAAAVNDIATRKKQIINKINQFLGSQKIKNIKVKISG